MRKKIMALVMALTCAVSVLGSSVSTKATVIHETELEKYIMEEMNSANILGMGISIVSPDKELYCAAYGTGYETEADYVLGSLSKSFTAAGIMRMSEDGDISLEDTVSEYLPDYKEVADVTIQELLNHTSGITAEQKMSSLQLTGKRGQFQYANANYNLLGEIIEKVSGMSYEEYISDNILDPLDMTSTYSMRTGSELSSDLLAGYKSYFGFPFASKYEYNQEDDWLQVPSGYLISDIKDMGKYLQMYLKQGADVLSKESVDMLLYNGVDTSSDSEIAEELFDGSATYAMGWMEKDVNGHKILFHAGTVENFMTMMVLLPEKELGITMMFNSMDYLVGKELIQNLQEGIVSIELEETPAKADSNTYLVQHGIIDGIMLIALLLAWLPIFTMGVWCRRRRNKLLNIPGILLDVVINVILPTVILFCMPKIAPTFMLKRFVPDLYYVIWAVTLSLYLGAVIKLISGIVLKIMGPKKEEEEPTGEVLSEEKEEQPAETKVGTEKEKTSEKTSENKGADEAEKPEKSAENKDADEVEKPEKSAEGKETEERETAEETAEKKETEEKETSEEAAAKKETEEKETAEEAVEKRETEEKETVEEAVEKKETEEKEKTEVISEKEAAAGKEKEVAANTEQTAVNKTPEAKKKNGNRKKSGKKKK